MLTLSENSLDWTLQHVLRYGDTDVFPIPFEYEAIHQDWDNIKRHLCSQNVLQWTVRPHRILLSPKAKYGFRVIMQIDPLDFLLFATTIKEIAEDIEARRIPINDNRVFSYRVLLDSNGQLFDPNIGYRDFLSKCQQTLDSNSEITYVAITDIADFYPRIYLHRLENALQSATERTSHIKTIMHLLAGWNGTESFGIPIGNAPSRILAEITIADVDEALLANGINFIRFNDDYRIFAKSYAEGYRHIAFLAEILFRNHGLSLQPQKTDVLPTETFKSRYLLTVLDREVNSLHERFEQLAVELGLDSWYEPIEYQDLNEEQKEAIDALNLVEIFRDEIKQRGEPELSLIRFVLRRLGQLGDSSILNDVFENLDILHPVFPDIIEYIRNLRHLNQEQKQSIGNKVLDLLDDSILSELTYHRMWASICSLIPENGTMNQDFSNYTLLNPIQRLGES